MDIYTFTLPFLCLIHEEGWVNIEIYITGVLAGLHIWKNQQLRCDTLNVCKLSYLTKASNR